MIDQFECVEQGQTDAPRISHNFYRIISKFLIIFIPKLYWVTEFIMSQITDIYGYASPSLEGLPLDVLQHLTPDDTLSQRESQSKLASESQFDSVPDLLDNQVQSRTGPWAPDTLTRIKPDSINEYIIFTTNLSAEFVKWWLQTDFGKKKRLNWEVSRRADCWTGFQQVAHAKDRKPGVMQSVPYSSYTSSYKSYWKLIDAETSGWAKVSTANCEEG